MHVCSEYTSLQSDAELVSACVSAALVRRESDRVVAVRREDEILADSCFVIFGLSPDAHVEIQMAKEMLVLCGDRTRSARGHSMLRYRLSRLAQLMRLRKEIKPHLTYDSLHT